MDWSAGSVATPYPAPGITLTLAVGVRLDVVQRRAGHASPGTMGLYDQRPDAEIFEGTDTTRL